MFGEEYHIVREFPEYFLDYREMLDPTIRWTDRLQSSSGDWSGNVFDFFFRVNSKIAKDIKKPFKLEGITRVDDTPVHKAVREALVNCLVKLTSPCKTLAVPFFTLFKLKRYLIAPTLPPWVGVLKNLTTICN